MSVHTLRAAGYRPDYPDPSDVLDRGMSAADMIAMVQLSATN